MVVAGSGFVAVHGVVWRVLCCSFRFWKVACGGSLCSGSEKEGLLLAVPVNGFIAGSQETHSPLTAF